MSHEFREAVRAFQTPADPAGVEEMRRLFSEAIAGWVGPFVCACIPDCLCARQCEEGAQQGDDAP